MSQSSPPNIKYRIRPATFLDVPAVTRLYASSFANEPLIDFFFPTRREDPESFYTWAYRRFQCRYWTLGYSLTVVVDKHDHPAGFSWWKEPTTSLSYLQKITTLSFWISPLVNAVTAVTNLLFPVHGYELRSMEAFEREFSSSESQVLDTPARREARYLAMLAVDPVLQGQGIGQFLLHHDLRNIDKEGSIAWLLSLAGLERFYGKFGFRETVKVDIEELGDWKGGMIMLRDQTS